MKKLTLISLSTDSLKKTTKEFPFPAVKISVQSTKN